MATAIDIGSGATYSAASKVGDRTYIDYNNPANATGTLTSFQIYALVSMISCYAIVFREASSGYFTAIVASENLGAVNSEAARTFDINLSVHVGDFLGVYFKNGSDYICAHTSGYDGVYYKVGDQRACENILFDFQAGDAVSIYGTGTAVEVEGGNAIFMGTNF